MNLANPSDWPPGMTFDFTTAINKVHDKLLPDFRRNGWFPALRSVLEGWFTPDSTLNETWNDSQYSLMSVHVLFLKTLWTKLFGIAAGPTPWELLRLDSNSLNTAEDIMIDPQPLFQHLLTSIRDEDFIAELAQGRYPCNDQGGQGPRHVKHEDSEDEDSDCEPLIRRILQRQRRHEH